MASCQPLKKKRGSGAESGSFCQWYGSADPDPYQNITDPQYCNCETLFYDIAYCKNVFNFQVCVFRQCILPMIVSKGNDQVTLTSKFEARDDTAVIRNAIQSSCSITNVSLSLGYLFRVWSNHPIRRSTLTDDCAHWITMTQFFLVFFS